MATFDSDGVEIAYEVTGDGDPIVFVHGFAANKHQNWVRTGWVDLMKRRRRKVVVLDNRGHGDSAKLYDPEQYGSQIMADDVLRLMDHLGIERADLVGYSMGAGIVLNILVNHPERCKMIVLAGVGGRMLEERERGSGNGMADAFEAEDPESIEDGHGKAFRMYAESLGQDLKAIAAVQKATSKGITRDDLAGIKNDVLVIAGEYDDLAGDPAELASAIPGARGIMVPGADHMYLLPHGVVKGKVMDFFEGMLDFD